MAKVIVRSGFGLLCDDGRRFEFVAGAQEIPDELIEHWYVKAHLEPEYDAQGASEPAPQTEPEKRKPGRPAKP